MCDPWTKVTPSSSQSCLARAMQPPAGPGQGRKRPALLHAQVASVCSEGVGEVSIQTTPAGDKIRPQFILVLPEARKSQEAVCAGGSGAGPPPALHSAGRAHPGLRERSSLQGLDPASPRLGPALTKQQKGVLEKQRGTNKKRKEGHLRETRPEASGRP